MWDINLSKIMWIVSRDKIKSILIIKLALLLQVSCNNTFEGYKLEGNFVKNFHDDRLASVKYTEPSNMFSINIPYNWDIQEDFTDSIFGVLFMDTLNIADSYENFKSIAITKYTQNKNLEISFKKEISLLKNDANEIILRIGKEKIKTNQSYWMFTNSKFQDDAFYNLTYFLQGGNTQELFLLQATVYATEDYPSVLNELHKYLKTFDLKDLTTNNFNKNNK
jgi:hypothetical protein